MTVINHQYYKNLMLQRLAKRSLNRKRGAADPTDNDENHEFSTNKRQRTSQEAPITTDQTSSTTFAIANIGIKRPHPADIDPPPLSNVINLITCQIEPDEVQFYLNLGKSHWFETDRLDLLGVSTTSDFAYNILRHLLPQYPLLIDELEMSIDDPCWHIRTCVDVLVDYINNVQLRQKCKGAMSTSKWINKGPTYIWGLEEWYILLMKQMRHVGKYWYHSLHTNDVLIEAHNDIEAGREEITVYSGEPYLQLNSMMEDMIIVAMNYILCHTKRMTSGNE